VKTDSRERPTALKGLLALGQTLSSPAGALSLEKKVRETLKSLCTFKDAVILLRTPGGRWKRLEGGTVDLSSPPPSPLPSVLLDRMQRDGKFAARLPMAKEVTLLEPISPDPEPGKRMRELWVPILERTELRGLLWLEAPSPLLPQGEFLAAIGLLATIVGQSRLLELALMANREYAASESSSLTAEKADFQFPSIIGQSQKMLKVFEAVQRVSPTRANVLLRGESGTGKELLARAIHQFSPRVNKPFVVVNCAALPESLIESELFGHEKGSFTGAVVSRQGRFEQADGGTLFLDEIGDLTRLVQVKLLRFLQERKFERVGGKKTFSVDVRIIAATNRNLEGAVAEGQFREDLFYRLNVVPVYLPPLRERKEDIPSLVGHFLGRFNAENGKRVKISAPAMDLIMGYSWRGNVRELENCVERMVVMAERDVISPEEVPLPYGHLTSLSSSSLPLPEEVPPLTESLEELERKRIEQALQKAGNVQAKAARLLGITQRQIGYKIKKFGIQLDL
jgi:Nif-specific regulatory protein